MADITGSGASVPQTRWESPDETVRGATIDRVSSRGLGRGALALAVLALLFLVCALSSLPTGRTALLVTYLVLALLTAGTSAYAAVLWRDHPEREQDAPDDQTAPGTGA